MALSTQARRLGAQSGKALVAVEDNWSGKKFEATVTVFAKTSFLQMCLKKRKFIKERENTS